MEENSYVVFLYPNGNKKIKEQAEFAKTNYLIENLKDHLINITWEDLVAFTENRIENKKIKKTTKRF